MLSLTSSSTTLLLRAAARIPHLRSYSVAVTRGIPDSFVDALSEHAATTESLSIQLARQQHEAYVQDLRGLIPTLELPALEDHPDCCFVEDTVVAIGNTAVITNPGHVSRRGEVDSIGQVLRQFGMNVVDMRETNEGAICDGGDVMFTGRHVFVGLSGRTNAAAAGILQESFRSHPVQVVDSPSLGGDVLHLKSIVTHLDSQTLVVPEGDAGDALIEKMQLTSLGYKTIRLDDIAACNLVVVNHSVLVQGSASPKSLAILSREAAERDMKLKVINTSELAKKDAALTCCSILLDI